MKSLTMKIELYTDKPIEGRCLLFAQRLATLVDMTGLESLEMSQRLFDTQYSLEQPLVLSTRTDVAVAELEKLCFEFGVLMRSLA